HTRLIVPTTTTLMPVCLGESLSKLLTMKERTITTISIWLATQGEELLVRGAGGATSVTLILLSIRPSTGLGASLLKQLTKAIKYPLDTIMATTVTVSP